MENTCRWGLEGRGMVNACFVIKTRKQDFIPQHPSAFLSLSTDTDEREAQAGSAAGAVTYAGVCLSPFSSHKKYRAALKKEKRKKRRQELARLRDSGNRLLILFSVYEVALPAPILAGPSVRSMPSVVSDKNGSGYCLRSKMMLDTGREQCYNTKGGERHRESSPTDYI